MQVIGSTRRLKRLGIFLGLILAAALIANGFMAMLTDWQVKRRIAAIRASGNPASIRELAPAPIPDSENAAVMLDNLGPRIDEFSNEYARWGDSPLGKDYEERTNRGEPATKEQIAAIRVVLDRYPDITAGLAAAAKCDKYASTADYSVGYQRFLDNCLKGRLGRVRTAARFLHWSAEAAIAEGKPEQAVEQGVEVMRLARLYDAEPLIVSLLVGIAVRGHACEMIYDGLAAGPVGPELHAAIEAELALHDRPQRLMHALTTYRAYTASLVSEIGSRNAPPDLPAPLLGKVVSWPMKRFYFGAMDFLDGQCALAMTSWPDPRALIAPPTTSLGVMADLLIPSVSATYGAEGRIVAVMRALRIFNALREFAEKNGREATGLEELKLPVAMTIDPFSDKPLQLKHTNEGWIVYSVMWGGDDGGSFIEMKDFGVAPARWRITEQGAGWR